VTGGCTSIDECVDGRACEALRQLGVDATSAHSLDRRSDPDRSQLAYAASENRAILTHDTDFLAESALLLSLGGHHSGVLLVPDRQDLRWLLRAVVQSLEAWRPDELQDQVRWLLPPKR
jgi:Domain of unknown function (DUF5615)